MLFLPSLNVSLKEWFNLGIYVWRTIDLGQVLSPRAQLSKLPPKVHPCPDLFVGISTLPIK